VEQVIAPPLLLATAFVMFGRAASGLVVVSLKLLLVIDASDLVTCIDIAAIKSIKKTSECEVQQRNVPVSCASPLSSCLPAGGGVLRQRSARAGEEAGCIRQDGALAPRQVDDDLYAGTASDDVVDAVVIVDAASPMSSSRSVIDFEPKKICVLLCTLIHLNFYQDSVTVKLSTPLAADELVTHVLECGAVGGRYHPSSHRTAPCGLMAHPH
jgi:hypothetical protein